MKVLHVIVSSYPWGFGEPTLESCLRTIHRDFDKIYIVVPEGHRLPTTQRKYWVPENAEIVNLSVKLSPLDKLLTAVTAILKRDFRQGVRDLRRRYHLRLTVAVLKTLLAYIGKAGKLVKAYGPTLALHRADENVAYTYWCTEYTYAAALLKRKGLIQRAFTHIRGWDCYFERSSIGYLPLRRIIFSELDLVFTVSDNGRNYLLNKIGPDPDKIMTAYIGTPAAACELTTKHEGPFRLVSVAFIVPLKRLPLLIDALALVRVPVHWHHIGGGRDEEATRAYATERLSSNPNVRFTLHGNKSAQQIADLFCSQAFHALVNTSQYEGLPISMMEAMSYGVPVIGTNVGGVSEIINDGVNGFLLGSQASPEQIASAIETMAHMSADNHEKMHTEALETWRSRFNSEKNFKELSRLMLMSRTREYRQCAKCILDTNDYPDIAFDERGVCNICHDYDRLAARTILRSDAGQQKLDNMVKRIKRPGKRKEYNCLIGVSGGVDSSMVVYLAKQWELRPLIVHVDGGWNTELAVSNIEALLDRLGYDLLTEVLDWEQMRDLQRAFIKANVLDIDLPFDNAFMAVLYKLARKHKIKHVLTGHNTETEGLLPPNFTHYKLDSLNLRDIHKTFGNIDIHGFPMVGPLRQWRYANLNGVRFYNPLDWMDYNKVRVKKMLMDDFGWRDYGGKHYENIFTRFYQGYILPNKFHVDKRKAHLSTLICSGQLTKEQALSEWQSAPLYPDSRLLAKDKVFFVKKLGMTEAEFDAYMTAPEVPHTQFKSWINVLNRWRPFYRPVKRLFSIAR